MNAAVILKQLLTIIQHPTFIQIQCMYFGNNGFPTSHKNVINCSYKL